MRLSRIWALLLLAVLGACAAPQSRYLLESPGALPATAEIASVPFVAQERFYCGPAALTMALAWSGLDVTQDEIAAEVYTPGRQGTLRSDVVAVARRHGRLAVTVPTLPALLGEIAAGHPVIIFQNLGLSWVSQWHFAVAIGYDLAAGEILLRSGLKARKWMSLSTFERTWKRGGFWALVVLPPGELPNRATEIEVLQAAVGVERAGQFAAAAAAYQAVIERWPSSFTGHMGLGNTRHSLGDFGGAAAAFRQAIQLDPEAPVPWNNLAYVLLNQGRVDDAVEAASQAILLARGDARPYAETLADILGRAAATGA